MKMIFFGNTKYSRIVEESLYKNFGLSLVVTLPDRIMGRKKILTPNPVKQFALENSVPIITAEKLDEKVIDQIQHLTNERLASSKLASSLEGKKLNARRYTLDANGIDFLVVADYGLLLPKKLLDLPKYAPLNVHPSLLPKYRGPTPGQSAILNGDKETGVTIIKLDEQIDHGPILAQEVESILKSDTADVLYERLFKKGSGLITSIIRIIRVNKRMEEKPQDEEKATFTKKLSKQDGFIDLENLLPAGGKIDRMIRAYYPWPNAWTQLRIKNKELRIKFLPGKKVQVEGKNPMDYKDFINGYPDAKEIIDKIFN
ncbi:hypothetical protein C4559_03755 [Candidatus Microgenomates bacterium]|nr:MAG: hypothetical protein C4559_03755 [Candidatus Microgenomates bacterium]